ncbi:MAG: DUF4154 domain-containing protein [Methylococcaceae bacterium]|nr:DUF4154 domain-containing protein [Methylococcaceae bacterium]
MLSPLIYGIDLEQKLKVAYLGRLLNYVTWPSSVEWSESKSFNICIIGTASFNKLLGSLSSRKLVKEKPVDIRYFDNVEESSNCHLLFISISEQAKITQILKFTKNKPILTIGETRGFAEKNGMIQFLMKGQKVYMKINYEAYRNHSFTISSDLFALSNVTVINR